MNYDIKIRGDKQDNGSIEFDRLNNITSTTKEIATKALMLRLKGFSDIKPDLKLKKALEIRLANLQGSKLEGTSMILECELFKETIKGLQTEIFKPAEKILNHTPMALVIQSFRSALIDTEDKDELDKPLLNTLLKFKKNFITDKEVFYFSNRGSIAEIEIMKSDFQKIEQLEESIPEPKKVIINGQLDEMKVSKNRLGLQTKEGLISVIANDSSIISGIVSFMGKEITISGMAHFKPSGSLSFVQIEEYFQPGKGDQVFSKKPVSMNAEQQVLFQLKQGKKRNPLKDITGLWPGEENLDDLLKMLDE